MNFIKKWGIGLLSMLPALAMAHPGHDHAHSGFMAGFIHPFTGLDHLVMALGFGILLWSAAKQWKIAGVIALSITLIVGFLVGAEGVVQASIAEYGIIASLIVTAIALWTKSNWILPIAAALLASFHGIAHGVELAHAGHIAALVAGMVTGMALIYCCGLALGALFTRYVPYGKKIMGTCAAIVAVIGLS
ncbi:HupE/UreJ family protein [Acinetobacter seifertii]|uniref:HupE/UreJ family protein n=1 Tax=Acinetobacter seifertii TaxID=1530123 RepID=A0ABX8L5Z7_9GAMM|nr:HupE/UreJ family protein [Acinetobacter seifertii]QXB47479.1 HupE/UreJ family protein [Acinetobacter seifertii]